MPTYTTNYDFALPLVNNAADQDLWGDELNSNFTALDSLLETATNWIKRVVTGADAATIADRNKIILGDATIASYAQTLPSAATVGDGFAIAFVKSDATVNTVTVTAAGADTIGTSATTIILSNRNDYLTLISDGVSNWNIQARFSPAISNASTSAAGIIQLATNAEVKTATNSLKAVVPSAVLYSPAVAKAWVKFAGATGVIASSYNVTSVSRTGTGLYTITFTTAMADTSYAPQISTLGGVVSGGAITSQSTGSLSVITYQSNTGAAQDCTAVYVTVNGNF